MPSNRPKQARAIESRRKLLEATVLALVENGYASTTTARICEAAGLSQGALFKHFPTKAALMVAAAEHLFQRVREAFQAACEAARAEPDRVGGALRLFDRSFRDPLHLASLELFVAARNDRGLAEALEPIALAHREALRREASGALGVVPGDSADADAFVQLVLSALQGRAVGALAGAGASSDVGELIALYRLANREFGGSAGEPQAR
jgi:AcrR family transcriptional regulator